MVYVGEEKVRERESERQTEVVVTEREEELTTDAKRNQKLSPSGRREGLPPTLPSGRRIVTEIEELSELKLLV